MDGKSNEWRPGPTVCRCCLSEGCYKDISTEYFWMGKREVYAEMLSETFDLTVSYARSGTPNSHSRLICEPCISRLRDAADFKRQVKECEQTFLQCFNPASAVDIEIPMDITDKDSVKVEKVKQEKENSYDDDDFADAPEFLDDDDDLDDQPLMNLATKVPKKESVDVMDLLDNAKAVKRKASKTKSSPAKRKVKEVKPSASKTKPERKKKGPVDISTKKIMWKQRRKFNDQRDNAAIVIECSSACPFRWRRGCYTCAYCPSTFADFETIEEHSSQHPNRIDALKFARTFDYIKVEITNLKCTICNEKMTDLEALKDHLIADHEKPIIKDLGLGVTPFLLRNKELLCAHCGERFMQFTKLNTHMNQHYPNNICCHCGKAFSAAHRLKAHQIIHETDNNKCTRCDKVFESRLQKNRHIYLTHTSEFRYRCPYCNEAFKTYSERLKHLRNAHGKKVEYPCNFCSSVFSMYNQRTRHIKQVHIKHRPFLCEQCPYKFGTAAQLRNHMVKHEGERKFQCEVCKKMYARMKTLKEHLRIHNNDKRFVCEYCNSGFVQKCSLKNHLRTHHPNSENSL
ncbi:zinc finger protein 181-like isoform X6 [Colias croceus]|uniref:zinc finger protein 181-like isoform X6 n=1 Tax=Colias crocea TaxID=72248 RepID=UPI001E27BCF5|nr:zinc finger protein 181-like isoform X6 [Colias croceus]